MERQTLDMEGARFGDVLAASLQFEDHTIAIQRIATMSVEKKEFFPWETPKNRRTQKAYATFSIAMLFFGFIALLSWNFMIGNNAVLALGAAGGLLLLAVLLGFRSMLIAVKMANKVPYFQLTIGTSDGRQIPLVDDNREVLARIRDIVRFKMDTGDKDVVGDFDLNHDIVNVSLPREKLAAEVALVPATPPAGKPAKAMFAPKAEKPDTPEILFDDKAKASKTGA